VSSVEISGIRKMFEAAPPNSINLGLGEPDFDPPRVVIDALAAATNNGMNHYGPSAGILPLRDKIAERYARKDSTTSRENVIITNGGSEALMVTAMALYDPGDEVLVPNPGFVLYPAHARLVGAVPVPYSLRAARKFLPDLGELESLVTSRTRVLVVNSPSNPTGGVFPRFVVDQLIAFAEKHDLTIVSDEVYEQIVYDAPATSFWGRTDRAVIVNSFSKTLAMTGWRAGFLVASKRLAPELNKVHYHIMACPSTPVQAAVLAGLEAGDGATLAMVREFRTRRELVGRLFSRVPGVELVRPAGAFYVFPSFTWTKTALEAATDLLARGVITTPGDAFGSLGAGHLRVSFAASRENLRQGIGMIREYAEEVGGSS
jgi:aspartate aminotransferase